MMLPPPFLGEGFKLRVDPIGHDDGELDQLVAMLAALALDTASLQTQRLPGVGGGRDSGKHVARDRGHLDLAPEHGLVESDRHLDDDVVALAVEQGMWPDQDLDQRIARWRIAMAGHAFALEAHDLAGLHPWGDGHIESAAV